MRVVIGSFESSLVGSYGVITFAVDIRCFGAGRRKGARLAPQGIGLDGYKSFSVLSTTIGFGNVNSRLSITNNQRFECQFPCTSFPRFQR